MSDNLSQSTCLDMLHPKTDEYLNPSVEVYYLFGKLSTAETLLIEVQRSFLAINDRDREKLDLNSLGRKGFED